MYRCLFSSGSDVGVRIPKTTLKRQSCFNFTWYSLRSKPFARGNVQWQNNTIDRSITKKVRHQRKQVAFRLSLEFWPYLIMLMADNAPDSTWNRQKIEGMLEWNLHVICRKSPQNWRFLESHQRKLKACKPSIQCKHDKTQTMFEDHHMQIHRIFKRKGNKKLIKSHDAVHAIETKLMQN